MVRSFLPALACAAALSMAGAAHSTVLTYSADLSGLNEVPPNASPAFGAALMTIDDALNTMTLDVTFAGLVGGPTAAAHLHCCTAPGSNSMIAVSLPGFPAATSGAYVKTFDLMDASIYSSFFLAAAGGTAAGAEFTLLAGLADGQTYLNIANAVFPAGELRGNLLPPAAPGSGAAPEPAAWALMIVGFGLAGMALRRRARAAPAA